MEVINLLFRVVFFLTIISFNKVRNESLKSTSSPPHQHGINLVHYVWTVDHLYFKNYKECSDYFIESPTFSAATDDTFKWYLRLEPNQGAYEDYLNLYLRLSPDSKKPKAWILLNFDIWYDEERTLSLWNEGFSDFRQINNNTIGWGFTNISQTDDILLNNKMIFSCDIKYREDPPMLSHPHTTTPQMNPSNNNYIDKLKSLFDNEKFAEIVLIVNGTKYPAHKTILAAHSPFFATMIERSLKKGETLKRFNITNTNETVAFEILPYSGGNLESPQVLPKLQFIRNGAFIDINYFSSSPHQHDIDLVPLHEVHYIWTVDRLYFYNYMKPDDFFIESPTFSADTDNTFKWYLRFEPVNRESETFNLYLRLSPESEKSQAWTTVKFTIWTDEKRNVSRWQWGFLNHLKEINNTVGLGTRCKPSYMFTYEDDKVVISCDIKYCENLPILFRHRTTTPYMNLANNNQVDTLSSLFNNEKFADITVDVNGTKYTLHEAILAAHSPLIANMIERSLKKSKILKRLNITNTNEQVAVEMVRYMYTGKCENLTNIADQLLVVADKYDLNTLKMICAETLGKLLTIENAAKTLALANKHGTADLKTKAITFIATKYIEVSNTTDWKCIAKKYPELVQDIRQHQHVLSNNTPS